MSNIAKAVEEVCAKYGLDEDAEWATLVVTQSLVRGDRRVRHHILRVLQTAAPRTVSREALAVLCRGETEWPVRAHITRLRKEHPGRIETVWGYGYRWVN